MTRPLALAVSLGAALGAALPAVAQPAADFIPRPDLDARPRAEAPPRQPAPAPLAPAAHGIVLKRVILDGATAVPEAELAPIWTPLLGQTVSADTLSALAAQVSAAYRARGYVLSQAILPEQSLADGTLHIAVIEGFVDQVAVDGGTPAQQTTLHRLFGPVATDRPLHIETLERSVLLARDTYGAGIDTVVAPSPTTFGAADMTVLARPDRFTGFASADNRGSRLYGAFGVTAGVSAYDLLGLAERLDGLVALAPQDGALSYIEGVADVPLPWFSGTWLDGGRFEFHADTSHGKPDLGRSGSPDGLSLTSDETNLRAGLIVPFIRTRSMNLFGRAGLDWQEATSVTGFAGGSAEQTDRLTVARMSLSWDVADRHGGVTLLEASVRHGVGAWSDIGGTGPAAGDPDFVLATLGLTRLQRLGASPYSLWLEATGQMAADVLPNSERFALGDSTIGRGFAPGNTTGDSGWGGRVELRRQVEMPEKMAQAMELYAFADYGRAYDRSAARDGIKTERLGSFGLGARIDLTNWLTLTPEIARQSTGTASDTTDPDYETRFYVSLVARF
ncbi:MAG: POTRA domain-containing protein [Amaricoccus sp.]|uniref:ShlB/FhaC/HecB family hemolysin secretion/activation protein n=1 Tax=Amaricoccus sp. TaxID=1872485 RepID=UPI0039E324CB